MSNYRVVWIDDEWDEQLDFIKWCKSVHDIEIVAFKTSKEGMVAFESSLHSWDAVLLDVEVYNESENEVASAKGFQSSITKISSLEHRRTVPYFISTGKDAIKNNHVFLAQYDRVYIKGDDDEELIADLKAQADAQVETQIRYRYNDLFSWLPIPDELLNILMYIESNRPQNVDCLNAVRKMLEWVRNLCIERGLLPDSVTELNMFSRLLCDKSMKKGVPIYVQRSLHSCVTVSQEGSHLLSIDKAMKGGEAPYLLRSTVFELLNVLYWCKSLPNDADSIEAMRNKIISLITATKQETSTPDVFEGVIEQDSNRNYFCGEYLLNYRDMQYEDIGKKIKIKKCAENKQERTKDSYSYFVTKQNFEIL